MALGVGVRVRDMDYPDDSGVITREHINASGGHGGWWILWYSDSRELWLSDWDIEEI